jgi:hypothetical protein
MRINMAIPLVLLSIVLSGTPAPAQVIGCEQSQEPFANGFCARTHTNQKRAKGWVRGKAEFNTSSGDIHIWMQLETDSVLAGPCGKVAVDLLAADGSVIATAWTGEACRGGKPPGKAVRSDSDVVTKQIVSPTVAMKVAMLRVYPMVPGIKKGLWGLTFLGFLDPVHVILVKIPL